LNVQPFATRLSARPLTARTAEEGNVRMAYLLRLTNGTDPNFRSI
jgi:hypothetical protein